MITKYISKNSAVTDLKPSINRQSCFNDIRKHEFILADNFICLPIEGKNYLNISTKNITQLEAHSNYTLFYFVDGNTLLVSKTMKEYLGFLDEHFVRIHKKFVINLRYLSQFDLSEESCVLLKDGRKLSISRRKKKVFMEKTKDVFGEINFN
jgi:two-component system, LytTR family, response regulator